MSSGNTLEMVSAGSAECKAKYGCESWSETCAAYRFLANPDVEWKDIMAPHGEQTQSTELSSAAHQHGF